MLEKVVSSLFLDAFSHLYMRVCPSVRPSVRPSVGPSVGPSVSIKEVRARTHLMAVYPALFHCVMNSDDDKAWKFSGHCIRINMLDRSNARIVRDLYKNFGLLLSRQY